MNKWQLGHQGQATLETTIALIAAVILLLGISRVFIWVNKIMVLRHEVFQQTQEDVTVDFYTPEKLNIFGTKEQ